MICLIAFNAQDLVNAPNAIQTWHRLIQIVNAQRAVVSLENIMQKNNTRFALDGFVRTIAGIMPNVEYRYFYKIEMHPITFHCLLFTDH